MNLGYFSWNTIDENFPTIIPFIGTIVVCFEVIAGLSWWGKVVSHSLLLTQELYCAGTTQPSACAWATVLYKSALVVVALP
jgi:hypothetical protein